jgi:hypothetical protein
MCHVALHRDASDDMHVPGWFDNGPIPKSGVEKHPAQTCRGDT